MLGAIAGDVVGSVYEFHPWQGNLSDFPLFSKNSRFTDDTVLTLAIADALMEGKNAENLTYETISGKLSSWGKKYPKAGYGQKFFQWLIFDKKKPNTSFGNGSAMRVSPIGWAFDSLDLVEKYAAISAEVTHNHPEGIKGACAVAGSIFLARTGSTRDDIKNYVSSRYGYNLDGSIETIRKTYRHVESCQESVPQAIIAFLESDDFETAVRKAVWLGGDADTQAAISGSIAEAFFKSVPEEITSSVLSRLDADMLDTLSRWRAWLGKSEAGLS